MECKKCGAMLPEDGKFCPMCGARGGWEKDLSLLPAERGGRGRLLYVLRQAAGRQKCLCGMRHRLRGEFLPAVRGGRVFEARGSRLRGPLTLRC